MIPLFRQAPQTGVQWIKLTGRTLVIQPYVNEKSTPLLKPISLRPQRLFNSRTKLRTSTPRRPDEAAGWCLKGPESCDSSNNCRSQQILGAELMSSPACPTRVRRSRSHDDPKLLLQVQCLLNFGGTFDHLQMG